MRGVVKPGGGEGAKGPWPEARKELLGQFGFEIEDLQQREVVEVTARNS